MVIQPGGTDLLHEEVTGKFIQAFELIFEAIEDYHKELDYPVEEDLDIESYNDDEQGAKEMLRVATEYHREFTLAIHAEASELLDAVPWKPWRGIEYKGVDYTNIAEEELDIMFFLGSIREVWNISPKTMGVIFERKLIENRRRIYNGYSLVGGR